MHETRESVFTVILTILYLGCGDRPKEKEVNLLAVDPPKITVTKKKRPPPKPLPGRCDSSEDCASTLKCILSQCRKAPCCVETDRDGDGVFEQRVVYTYDDEGNVLTKVTESGGGKQKERIAYTHDEQHHLVRTEVRRNGKLTEQSTLTYDDKGRLKIKTFTKGAAKVLTSYSYDSAGNKTRVSVDSDGDGKPNTEERYSYDAKGNLVTRENANLAKDKAIARRQYTYNENNRVKSEKLDRGADGLYEETTLYEYDGHGNELVRDWKSTAPTPERPDTQVRWVFKRDEHGNMVSWDVLGPKHDLRNRTVYTYNEKGDTLTKDEMQVAEGEVKGVLERIRYRYTPERFLLSEETVEGEDGQVKARIVYGYDCWR